MFKGKGEKNGGQRSSALSTFPAYFPLKMQDASSKQCFVFKAESVV